jgi:hypothetical protein
LKPSVVKLQNSFTDDFLLRIMILPGFVEGLVFYRSTIS